MKKKLMVTIAISSIILGLPIKNKIFAQNILNTNLTKEVYNNYENSLTQEESLNLLKQINNNLKFEYMGNENTFKCLKTKGLEGYVFLPTNIDTDLGYFIDKNTKDIYEFHPSGYLNHLYFYHPQGYLEKVK